MSWYGLGRPVIASKIGNWSVFVLFGWRLVFEIMIYHEMRRARAPAPSDVISDSGNIKIASLLRLGLQKMSGTND